MIRLRGKISLALVSLWNFTSETLIPMTFHSTTVFVCGSADAAFSKSCVRSLDEGCNVLLAGCLWNKAHDQNIGS